EGTGINSLGEIHCSSTIFRPTFGIISCPVHIGRYICYGLCVWKQSGRVDWRIRVSGSYYCAKPPHIYWAGVEAVEIALVIECGTWVKSYGNTFIIIK